jgi:replicative superfamily II helicase
VLIENHAFEKIQQLIRSHGADIMLWTDSNEGQTNVNIFLKRGYIMNTEYCYHMEEKLEFMINCCPAALKKYVIREYQKENAFTIILSRCHDVTNKRHSMIVHHAFQHLETTDLYEEYNESKETLLDLVASSGNALVVQYLERKFELRIHGH